MSGHNSGKTSDSPGYWRPLPLGYLLEKYGLLSKRMGILLGIWIFLLILSLVSVTYFVPSDWKTLESSRKAISLFLFFYPPLLICNFLLFWLGFEWGFIPAYLSTFMVALASDMPLHWALLFGIAVVLGMAIFALVYYSTRFRYTIRSLTDLAFFVGVAFVASMASSLGSLIWSHVQELTIEQTLVAWKSWWTGSFLQLVFLTAPVLYLVGNRFERLKDRLFDVPQRTDVSIRWVYSSIIAVTAVLCIFIFSAEKLGRLRIQETLNTTSNISSLEIIGAAQTFELTAWITIILVITAGLAGIKLVDSWNSILKKRVREKHALLAEVHHRVKNNLALVSGLIELQIQNTDSELVERELRKSHSRIYSMAKVHEKTYQLEESADIKIDDYVISVVNQIERNFKNKDIINFDLKVDSIKLIINQAVTFGLLLNELLTYTCKHMVDEQEIKNIAISVEEQDHRVQVELSVNGQNGLPSALELDNSNSLDIVLIKKLADQLESDLRVNENGQDTTKVEFSFVKELD